MSQTPNRLRRALPGEARELHAYAPAGVALGQSFTLVSWNLGKPRSDEARAQVLALAEEQGPALLALQESTLRLKVPGHMGSHFVRSHLSNGVCTAAVQRPDSAEGHSSPAREMGLATRKMALLTSYALADGQSLLLCNVHALNFDRTGRRFVAQMRALAERAKRHEGPLIFAGDFNTWSLLREDALRGILRDLSLVEVTPRSGQGRTGHAGRAMNRAFGIDRSLHLDRLFVRGLLADEAHWLEAFDASDHVPLLARLTLVS